jgi:hypothetical protein
MANIARFMGCKMIPHGNLGWVERFLGRRQNTALQRQSLVAFLVLLAGFLAGCDRLSGPKYPTLIPPEYVPTAIALTVEAGRPAASDTLEKNPTGTGLSVPPITVTRGEVATTTRMAVISPTTIKTSTISSTVSTSISPTPTPGVNTPTSHPLVTLSLSPTSVESTPTPLFTPTATPTKRYYRTLTATATPGIPNATILLYNPGQGSKLTSPISFSASLQPGASGRVLIELQGEDGRVLYRKLIRYITQDWVAISENVEFSISAAAEAGRLQISTEDEYGRIMALASVNVLLLSMGQDDLNPPADLLEPLIIREPLLNTLIQGGKVVVTGLVRTSGEQPLLVELVNAAGTVVGYRQAAVIQPADPWVTQGYGTFRVEVPYSVDGPTWVRVDVSAFEDRLDGPTHLSSVVILLGP